MYDSKMAKNLYDRIKTNNKIKNRLAKIGINIKDSDIKNYIVVLLDNGEVRDTYPGTLNEEDIRILSTWFKEGMYGELAKNFYNVDLIEGSFAFEVYKYFGCCYFLAGCILNINLQEKAKLAFSNSRYLGRRVEALGW